MRAGTRRPVIPLPRLCAGAAAFCAAAVLSTSAPAFGDGTLSFQFENDLLAGTDRHYTNGIRLAWVSAPFSEQAAWARDVMTFLYPFARETTARHGVAIGQTIFTPQDIRESQLIVGDRPYAGWLYLGLSLNVETTQRAFERTFDVLDTMELNLGVVGPWALGKQSQQFVHNVIGAQRPNGWGNQLNNEPGAALVLERKWRTPAARFIGLDADIIPSVAASVGNVNTSASVGTLLRVGQGLTVDYGPPQTRPDLTGTIFFERLERGFAWYAYAGVVGNAVARNIFLDGNTFGNSHSVNKRPVFGDVQAGLAVVYRRVRLSMGWTLRSEQFLGQDGPDRFGGINVSFGL